MAELLADKLKEKGLVKLVNEFLVDPYKEDFFGVNIEKLEKQIKDEFDNDYYVSFNYFNNDLDPGIKAIMVISHYILEYFQYYTNIHSYDESMFCKFNLEYKNINFLEYIKYESMNKEYKHITFHSCTKTSKYNIYLFGPYTNISIYSCDILGLYNQQGSWHYVDFYSIRNSQVKKSKNNKGLDIKIEMKINVYAIARFLEWYEKNYDIKRCILDDYIKKTKPYNSIYSVAQNKFVYVSHEVEIDFEGILNDYIIPNLTNFIHTVCLYYKVNIENCDIRAWLYNSPDPYNKNWITQPQDS